MIQAIFSEYLAIARKNHVDCPTANGYFLHVAGQAGMFSGSCWRVSQNQHTRQLVLCSEQEMWEGLERACMRFIIDNDK